MSKPVFERMDLELSKQKRLAEAKRQPQILLLDIETFPNVAYVWGKYDQNVIRFKREGCLATFVAKWLGEKKIISRALPNYPGYKPGSYNDRRLAVDLWKLLDAADIVVAHNGDAFDVRVCNSRFILHGLTPPSPFKTVDTKKAIKRVARFNSNKLDDLSSLLWRDKKIKTDFDLWEGCIKGNPASWAQMVRYNKKDVLLLEKLYLRVRPWTSNHPNFTVTTGAKCPKCNSSDVRYSGYAVTSTRSYRRFRCNHCGGWGRDVTGYGKTGGTNCA